MKGTVAVEQYMWGISFIHLDVDGQKIFGFSEFISGLAIVVIAWTLSDVRYKFRVKVATFPLIGFAFSSMLLIGALSLMTDLWRAEGWLVPKGDILTPAMWQSLLGLIFLFVLFVWAWIAFFRRVDFNKYNAKRFVQVLYTYVVRGDAAELAVVGDELKYAVWSVVRQARGLRAGRSSDLSADRRTVISERTEKYANEVLILIADRRLCRALVAASPGTIARVFLAVLEMRKYGVNVSVFAKNVVVEALLNRDSFLFHESYYWESGLIGHERPICSAIFSDFFMVEEIGSMFDAVTSEKGGYDSKQIEALCRVVLMTFRDYVNVSMWRHSFVLTRFLHWLPHCVMRGVVSGDARVFVSEDHISMLYVIVNFVKKTLSTVGEKSVPDVVCRDLKRNNSRYNIYDDLARLIYELISRVSYFNSPPWECYHVQRNAVWGEFFGPFMVMNDALRVVQFKVRRILYDEIVRMSEFPNYSSARTLAFCLNVMGLSVVRDGISGSARPLHRAMLSWIKRNFIRLYETKREVAESCLIGRFTYDSENARIVSTPFPGFLTSGECQYIDLER